jgi:transcription elongation GreA/GreB family factor
MDMNLKTQLIHHIEGLLKGRITEAEQAMAAAQEARNSDTKSSAGDKFETGRAMMQMEIDKLEAQLGKAAMLQKDLARVDMDRVCTKVEFGSLVLTDRENYFVAIGLGKVELDGRLFYAISMASPIGAALEGKRVGDAVDFQGRRILVTEII